MEDYSMSDKTKPSADIISWGDLTVRNAEAVREFYKDVVGWKPEPVSMGGMRISP